MKKNLYYKTMFRRHNRFKEFVYNFFRGICSIPRLLLEVFVRRNLGERYFSFSTAMLMAFILFIVPMIVVDYYPYAKQWSFWGFWGRFLTWYIYVGGFIYMCIQRRREVSRLPSVFDFGRYSLSTGSYQAFFTKYIIGGRTVDIRLTETIIEPAFFGLIGLALMIIGQPVGFLILICAICYSLSYFATYWQGDNFIMDKIDEMILNEEYVNAFVDGMDPDDTRGVRYYGRAPVDPEVRRQMVDSIIVDTDFVEAK